MKDEYFLNINKWGTVIVSIKTLIIKTNLVKWNRLSKTHRLSYNSTFFNTVTKMEGKKHLEI